MYPAATDGSCSKNTSVSRSTASFRNAFFADSVSIGYKSKPMIQASGMSSFRFPGGSSSDEFHFTDPPSYNGKGTAATFAKFIESVSGGAPQLVLLNPDTGDRRALVTAGAGFDIGFPHWLK